MYGSWCNDLLIFYIHGQEISKGWINIYSFALKIFLLQIYEFLSHWMRPTLFKLLPKSCWKNQSGGSCSLFFPNPDLFHNFFRFLPPLKHLHQRYQLMLPNFMDRGKIVWKNEIIIQGLRPITALDFFLFVTHVDKYHSQLHHIHAALKGHMTWKNGKNAII